MNDTLRTLWTDLLALLPGLLMSVQLTGVLLLIGLPLGLLLAVGLSQRLAAVRWPVTVVVELSRGVPALVIVYLVYFGLPQVKLTLTAFLAGSVALAINFAAYTSEIFKAGFDAIPAGQREAAQALGLSSFDAFRLVTLPQGVRIVIPPLLGYAIIYFQATSLCFAIAVPELLSKAYTVASTDLDYFTVLLLAGLLYAAVSIPGARLVAWMERRRDRHVTT